MAPEQRVVWLVMVVKLISRMAIKRKTVGFVHLDRVVGKKQIAVTYCRLNPV